MRNRRNNIYPGIDLVGWPVETGIVDLIREVVEDEVCDRETRSILDERALPGPAPAIRVLDEARDPDNLVQLRDVL